MVGGGYGMSDAGAFQAVELPRFIHSAMDLIDG